ncbi:hypothetical protein E2C00_22585 [Streptomyces sp. WAC05374]|uniref:hypothetical protein n=1 Tax=Streptomyces sp. WAC05374 TaxID=2487420 RepID=UPI000F8937C1|nr:hypothetical protein [Streptomyces sp. WAC05374]RST13912.1 hypothetical protein EF905_18980 [Streptomyces sp. WAC05374]TDF46045.1 hypothetical protein E2B92_11590 [Streptomyces sp. WAC05374]TDF53036.1 hypothetical protein E2C00_22585 [Streptomyces sp. WAC05374]TDF58252.1 hypothetical protein E2C02_06975 [Streptomyces sp. WAC05374]
MNPDSVAAWSGLAGNVIAVAVAVLSLRKAERALAQSERQSALGLQRADAALTQAQVIAERTLDAHYRIDGAQSAIAWRDQVIALHDRGLTPAQIRHIMLLEDGGAGYEASNGRIDDIVRNLPRA